MSMRVNAGEATVWRAVGAAVVGGGSVGTEVFATAGCVDVSNSVGVLEMGRLQAERLTSTEPATIK